MKFIGWRRIWVSYSTIPAEVGLTATIKVRWYGIVFMSYWKCASYDKGKTTQKSTVSRHRQVD